jgi:hypothetical protein
MKKRSLKEPSTDSNRRRVFARCAAFISLFCLVGGVSGCASLKLPPGLRQLQSDVRRFSPFPPPEPVTNFWRGDEFSGRPSMVVALSEQQAFFYKGGQLAGQSEISTGRDGFETPVGRYKVLQKDRHHVSSLYGDYVNSAGEVVKANVDVNRDHRPKGSRFRGAKMPYFMRIKAGYGLHAGYLPGYPASHGCIRMPHEMAAHFYHASSIGTPVRVVP